MVCLDRLCFCGRYIELTQSHKYINLKKDFLSLNSNVLIEVIINDSMVWHRPYYIFEQQLIHLSYENIVIKNTYLLSID